jgi:hypothetical protein
LSFNTDANCHSPGRNARVCFLGSVRLGAGEFLHLGPPLLQSRNAGIPLNIQRIRPFTALAGAPEVMRPAVSGRKETNRQIRISITVELQSANAFWFWLKRYHAHIGSAVRCDEERKEADVRTDIDKDKLYAVQPNCLEDVP